MRSRVLGVLALLAVVSTACGGDESAEAARELRRRKAGAELKVAGIPEGGVVQGNTATLELSGAGVRIVEPDGDTSGRTGHYAVFVDTEPVAMGEEVVEGEDVIESTEDKVQVTGLAPGAHELAVVLADGNRRRIGETVARAEVRVVGPSVYATAAPPTEPRQPVVLTITAVGVQITPPNADVSQATGHFAVFLDREPTPLGTPVPDERGIVNTSDTVVALRDIGSGEHFVWVLLLRGDKTPFEPMITDRVEFEVKG